VTDGEIHATSTRPYLVRAIRDWALDNGLTPYLVVDATFAGVQVPTEHVENDRITLNVADRAIVSWATDDEGLQFGTRFAGRHRLISVPWPAVLAVFARENGEGIAFPPGDEVTTPEEGAVDAESGAGTEPPTPGPRGRPVLKRIK